MGKLAILISENGTTMQAIVKAWKKGTIPLDNICVLSSSPTALGIKKAQQLGILQKDILVINPEKFRERDKKVNQKKFGLAILKELKKRGITIILQSGWLPLTPENVIAAFPNSIFNQHPGPLPHFGGKGMYGRRVHAAVLLFHRLAQKQTQWTEATTHIVSKEFDQGRIIKTVKVPIFPQDTVDTLQKRVLAQEHKLQITILKALIKGQEIKSTPGKSSVLPQEEDILEQAKQVARLLYPLG